MAEPETAARFAKARVVAMQIGKVRAAFDPKWKDGVTKLQAIPSRAAKAAESRDAKGLEQIGKKLDPKQKGKDMLAEPKSAGVP